MNRVTRAAPIAPDAPLSEQMEKYQFGNPCELGEQHLEQLRERAAAAEVEDTTLADERTIHRLPSVNDSYTGTPIDALEADDERRESAGSDPGTPEQWAELAQPSNKPKPKGSRGSGRHRSRKSLPPAVSNVERIAQTLEPPCKNDLERATKAIRENEKRMLKPVGPGRPCVGDEPTTRFDCFIEPVKAQTVLALYGVDDIKDLVDLLYRRAIMNDAA